MLVSGRYTGDWRKKLCLLNGWQERVKKEVQDLMLAAKLAGSAGLMREGSDVAPDYE